MLGNKIAELFQDCVLAEGPDSNGSGPVIAAIEASTVIMLHAMIEQIDHINIVVDDLPRMIAFYRGQLGLRVTKEVTIRGDWVEATVRLKDVLADVVYLEGTTGARLELIKYRFPDGGRPVGVSEPNAKGIRHLAFRVRGIDEMAASLKRAGVRIVSDVQAVPDSQVTYAGGVRKRLVYFYDPEGNLLELCEYA